MKDITNDILEELIGRLPELTACRDAILLAYDALVACYSNGGKLLVCGNGGSSADSEHIVGELMKGFKLKRPVSRSDAEKLRVSYPQDGAYLAANLQRALPALSLTSHTALASAFANDISPQMVFAQQVFGLGRAGDVLMGISTSGNADNVVNAVKVAKTMGLKTIGLTGGGGGKLAMLCDVSVIVPANETYRVQEYHLPIYHALCAMLENEFFGG